MQWYLQDYKMKQPPYEETLPSLIVRILRIGRFQTIPLLMIICSIIHRKWYHKNVIYELATIKNSIDTVEQDISIGFEMTWWRYGPFVRGVEKDLHVLRTDYVDHVPIRSMLQAAKKHEVASPIHFWVMINQS